MKWTCVFLAAFALAFLCGSAAAQGGWYTSNVETVNEDLCKEFDDCERLACETACNACEEKCDLRFGYPIRFHCNKPARTLDATDVCENWYQEKYSVQFSPSAAGKLTITATAAVFVVAL
eukprot:CAMPEP_0114606652 /NCGR_PEP_ID=MMETSP0168-20121206/1674_1 /TAXON_ID=95228 ORGANISM="Vannella sp., Strain DIVA3 517/6/12" /NCGR_SAMPLE_ID=MMETSP0168 /ASSEMBLY_ACC=CAM_ASM_000044 /LENGTH=119 /DNA_ID=CAMNT_0001817527 /DNA_START=29 /DNA_END=385 /DNA_ORIENTATION=-